MAESVCDKDLECVIGVCVPEYDEDIDQCQVCKKRVPAVFVAHWCDLCVGPSRDCRNQGVFCRECILAAFENPEQGFKASEAPSKARITQSKKKKKKRKT